MNVKFLPLLSFAILASGCVTAPPPETDVLKSRAASSLGARANTVTLSEVKTSGARTEFIATVGGVANNCYVESSFALPKSNLSDAVCNRIGAPSRNPLLRN